MCVCENQCACSHAHCFVNYHSCVKIRRVSWWANEWTRLGSRPTSCWASRLALECWASVMWWGWEIRSFPLSFLRKMNRGKEKGKQKKGGNDKAQTNAPRCKIETGWLGWGWNMDDCRVHSPSTAPTLIWSASTFCPSCVCFFFSKTCNQKETVCIDT